jgi:hypothetical protein
MEIQENLEGLELDGKHQSLFYADVNVLDEDTNEIINAEALLACYKETGQEVNRRKIKYMAVLSLACRTT